jgi:tetratricopeptide (TPR) repeat protein
MKKLILLALLIVATASASDSIPGKAKRAIFRSQQLCEKEDWAGSIKLLRDCLTKSPDQDHYLLRFYLANSLTKIDSLETAVQHYQKAVSLNSEFINGWLNLAETAYATEQYATAGDAFEKAFRLKETPTQYLLYYAGVCNSLANRNSKALILLQELLLTGEPKPDWLQTTVAVAMEVSESAVAQKVVNQFCEIYPENPSAWLLAYQFYAAENDYENAASAMKIKSYLQPLSVNEQFLFGDILFAAGVPAEAANLYSTAIDRSSDMATVSQYEMLASALLSAQKTDLASEAINKALKIKPTTRLYSLLGDVEYSRENYKEAFNAFSSAADINPDNGRLWLMAGYCAVELEKYGDAKLALERACMFSKQKQSATELLQQLSK